MAIIVPGVCRFTVEQTLENRPVANIIDMRIDTTGSTANRAESIRDQAEVILDNWTLEILEYQSDDLTFDAVRWVDLDSDDGSTGTVTSTSTYTLPLAGTGAGATLPNNTAALVRKQLATSQRGQRAGRMYWAGLVESITAPDDGNVITPDIISIYNTQFADFLGAINQEGGGLYGYDSAMCVVHVTSRDEDGKPLTGVSNDVGALIVDPLLATQRRRLRR